MSDRIKGLSSLRLPVLFGILMVVGLLGLTLATRETPSQPASASESVEEVERFRQDVVGRLEQLLQSVEGVGEVQVMVTVKTVYEEEGSPGTNSNQTDASVGGLFSSSAQNQEKHREQTGAWIPCVDGVAVVCTGAKDSAIRLKITQLITGLYGIGTNRVCVIN